MAHCRDARNRVSVHRPSTRRASICWRNSGSELFKIPSGEITNLPYLRHVGRLRQATHPVHRHGDAGGDRGGARGTGSGGHAARPRSPCSTATPSYPTPMEDVNLRAMLTIRDSFGVQVGYSDHTPGIEVAIAAVALGATRHREALDTRSAPAGARPQASLEPAELARDGCRHPQHRAGARRRRSSARARASRATSPRPANPWLRRSVIRARRALHGRECHGQASGYRAVADAARRSAGAMRAA